MSTQSGKAAALNGTITVPGDKSMSHRALMFGALALGQTTIQGLLEGEDVLATAEAMRQLGASVAKQANGGWQVTGRGVGGLMEPDDVLDMGNSGTAARLLMGLVASYPFVCHFTGDASLRSRPMKRVTDPLSEMGASFMTRSGGRLPLAIQGTRDPLPIRYVLPVASAQVKSAILLAGLNTPGITEVIEPHPTRDHSETMLRHFGAEISVEDQPDGSRLIRLTGQPELLARDVIVPADISSAAFPMVAALITPGSDITLQNIGLNPLRAGIIDSLRDMGGQIDIVNERVEAGEPVGDIRIRHSALKGCTIPASRAPAQIDEYPVLAVAASFAEGETHMPGVAELRVKESDRLALTAHGLAACGVETDQSDDSLTVHGMGPKNVPHGGALIESHLDHRIAMSFMVMGMNSEEPVTIDDASPIETSFPGFQDLMNGLGANIGPNQV